MQTEKPPTPPPLSVIASLDDGHLIRLGMPLTLDDGRLGIAFGNPWTRKS